MFKKIVLYLLFPMLIFSLVLYFMGVRQIEFGNDYYDFMRLVAYRLSGWRLVIPNIPQIPYISSGGWLDVFNVLIGFVNALSSIINVLLQVVNLIITIVQFVLTLIELGFEFGSNLGDPNLSVW